MGIFAGGFTGDARRCNIDIAQARLQTVLLKPVGCSAEGVGLDNLGAGVQVFRMDLAHQVRIAEV